MSRHDFSYLILNATRDLTIRGSMKSYLFSIFVRMFLAGSGFLVFLVSAKLFGAEGRGVISYGTSIFSVLGLIFSFNLGKAFLAATNQNHDLKRKLLPHFIVINLGLTALTLVSGFVFWFVSDAARNILSFPEVIAISVASFFYVWSINGSSFFASFVRTFQQDMIIFATRLALVVFLVLFLIFDSHSINRFLMVYSLILSGGVIIEILTLKRMYKWHFEPININEVKMILSKSFWPHIDFLSFNVFPLLLIVISGWYIGKSEIGRASFAFQVINLVFLLSTTANIRLTSYVSDVGFRARMPQFKKLFLYTIVASVFLSTFIYLALNLLVKVKYFSSFDGVSELFLYSVLSVPGYCLYQFLNPIWLEINYIKSSTLLNLLNLGLMIVLSVYALQKFGVDSIPILFSLFHFGILLAQVYLLRKYLNGR